MHIQSVVCETAKQSTTDGLYYKQIKFVKASLDWKWTNSSNTVSIVSPADALAKGVLNDGRNFEHPQLALQLYTLKLQAKLSMRQLAAILRSCDRLGHYSLCMNTTDDINITYGSEWEAVQSSFTVVNGKSDKWNRALNHVLMAVRFNRHWRRWQTLSQLVIKRNKYMAALKDEELATDLMNLEIELPFEALVSARRETAQTTQRDSDAQNWGSWLYSFYDSNPPAEEEKEMIDRIIQDEETFRTWKPPSNYVMLSIRAELGNAVVVVTEDDPEDHILSLNWKGSIEWTQRPHTWEFGMTLNRISATAGSGDDLLVSTGTNDNMGTVVVDSEKKIRLELSPVDIFLSLEWLEKLVKCCVNETFFIKHTDALLPPTDLYKDAMVEEVQYFDGDCTIEIRIFSPVIILQIYAYDLVVSFGQLSWSKLCDTKDGRQSSYKAAVTSMEVTIKEPNDATADWRRWAVRYTILSDFSTVFDLSVHSKPRYVDDRDYYQESFPLQKDAKGEFDWIVEGHLPALEMHLCSDVLDLLRQVGEAASGWERRKAPLAETVFYDLDESIYFDCNETPDESLSSSILMTASISRRVKCFFQVDSARIYYDSSWTVPRYCLQLDQLNVSSVHTSMVDITIDTIGLKDLSLSKDLIASSLSCRFYQSKEMKTLELYLNQLRINPKTIARLLDEFSDSEATGILHPRVYIDQLVVELDSEINGELQGVLFDAIDSNDRQPCVIPADHHAELVTWTEKRQKEEGMQLFGRIQVFSVSNLLQSNCVNGSIPIVSFSYTMAPDMKRSKFVAELTSPIDIVIPERSELTRLMSLFTPPEDKEVATDKQMAYMAQSIRENWCSVHMTTDKVSIRTKDEAAFCLMVDKIELMNAVLGLNGEWETPTGFVSREYSAAMSHSMTAYFTALTNLDLSYMGAPVLTNCTLHHVTEFPIMPSPNAPKDKLSQPSTDDLPFISTRIEVPEDLILVVTREQVNHAQQLINTLQGNSTGSNQLHEFTTRLDRVQIQFEETQFHAEQIDLTWRSLPHAATELMLDCRALSYEKALTTDLTLRYSSSSENQHAITFSVVNPLITVENLNEFTSLTGLDETQGEEQGPNDVAWPSHQWSVSCKVVNMQLQLTPDFRFEMNQLQLDYSEHLVDTSLFSRDLKCIVDQFQLGTILKPMNLTMDWKCSWTMEEKDRYYIKRNQQLQIDIPSRIEIDLSTEKIQRANKVMSEHSISKPIAAIKTYTLVFTAGSLGIQVVEADHSNVMVGGFKRLRSGEIGWAERSGKIRVGDLITHANDTDLTPFGYQKALEIIQKAKRPMKLTFQRNLTSKASMGTGEKLVTESMFENQRFFGPFLGWTSRLLPTDRPSWTDMQGKGYISLNDRTLPSNDPEHQWKWKTPWRLNVTDQTDGEGWEYAFSFPAIETSSGRMKTAQDFVRRRRWNRTRIGVPNIKQDDEDDLRQSLWGRESVQQQQHRLGVHEFEPVVTQVHLKLRDTFICNWREPKLPWMRIHASGEMMANGSGRVLSDRLLAPWTGATEINTVTVQVLHKNSWEPLIEPFSIDAQFQWQIPNSIIAIETSGVNLNLAIDHWKHIQEPVQAYTLRNETGVSLNFWSEHYDNAVTIENHSEVSFSTERDAISVILFGGWQVLQDLPLQIPGQRAYCLRPENLPPNLNLDARRRLYKSSPKLLWTVKDRTICISSLVAVHNETTEAIQIMIESRNGEKIELKDAIEPDGKRFLPAFATFGQVKIRPVSLSVWSEQSFDLMSETDAQEIRFSCSDVYNTILHPVFEPIRSCYVQESIEDTTNARIGSTYSHHQVTLRILPPFRLVNQLPCLIRYQVKEPQQAGTLEPNEIIGITTESPKYLRLQLNGTDWSNWFVIRDSNETSTTVLPQILLTNEFNIVRSLIVSSNLVVRDDTGLSVVFGTRNPETNLIQPIPGQIAPIVETVFQNQRWAPVVGWTSPSLPTDRSEWTDEAGHRSLRPDKFILGDGWTWAHEWIIDQRAPDTEIRSVEKQGWWYATDFPSSFHPEKTGLDMVRRRLWVRAHVPPKRMLQEEMKNICPLSSTSSKIKVAVRIYDSMWSKLLTFDLKQLHPQQIMVPMRWQNAQGKLVCGTVELIAVPESTTMVFSPKYQLVNQSSQSLLLQGLSSSDMKRLKPCETSVFVGSDTTCRVTLDSKNEYAISGSFRINRVGTIPLRIRHLTNTFEMRLISVKITRDSNGTFQITFSDEDETLPTFRISNSLRLPVEFRQVNSTLPFSTLRTGASVAFGWDSAMKREEFEIQLRIANVTSSSISFNRLATYPSVKLSNGMIARIHVYAEGPTRVLLITEHESHHEMGKKDKKSSEMALTVEIPFFSLSVIDTQRREVLYGVATGMEMQFSDSGSRQLVTLAITSCQVDDLVNSSVIVYSEMSPFLNLHLCRHVETAGILMHFEYLTLSLPQQTQVVIDDGLFDLLSQLIPNEASVSSKLLLHFDLLHIEPVQLILTYTGKSSVLGTIRQASVSFNLFVLPNSLVSIEQLQQELDSFYRRQMLADIASLAGSSELLGNPTEFIYHLGQGVQGIVDVPSKGLTTGAKKLVGHTLYGISSSAHGITSSLSKGLASFKSTEKSKLERKPSIITDVAIGALNIASKASAKISSKSKLSVRFKQGTCLRPYRRAFYGPQLKFQPYDEHDAMAQDLVYQMYRSDQFERYEREGLILTDMHLIAIKNKKVKWVLEWEDIRQAEAVIGSRSSIAGVFLHLKRSTDKEHMIQCESNERAKEILHLLDLHYGLIQL